MADEQKVRETRSWLKGYDKGMRDAWEAMRKLTRRGLTPAELKIMLDSEVQNIPRAVEERKKAFEKALGVSLDEEKKSRFREIPVMEAGQSYLVREDRPSISFELFKQLINDGNPPLCIVRTPPKTTRERYSIPEGIRVLWLTKSENPHRRSSSGILTATLGIGAVDADSGAEGNTYLSPTNLSTILSIIVDFLEGAGDGKNPVLLLEGVEYLITQNEFKSVLRFLQNINEKIAMRDAYFIVPITEGALEEKQFKLIEKEMSVVI